MIINIETRPGARRRSPGEFDPPGNYKDPEKIREYQEEKAEKDFWSQAVDITRAQVYCVTLLPELRERRPGHIHDFTEPTYIVDRGLGEDDVLARARDAIMSAQFDERLVAFNGADFDFPFLAARFLRYGMLDAAARVRSRTRYGDDLHVDPFVWLGGKGTLDEWAEFFGLQKTTAMNNPCSGAELCRAWVNGLEARRDLLVQHTRTRVVWARAIQAMSDLAVLRPTRAPERPRLALLDIVDEPEAG